MFRADRFSKTTHKPLTAEHGPNFMTNRIDPFDELAAMFLTAPQPQRPAGREAVTGRQAPGGLFRTQAHDAASSARTIMLELLIVGHLPVRGGLWLTPYADRIAQDAGAVAMVRLDGIEPSIQLLRVQPALASIPLRTPLQQTVLDLAGVIDAWLVRAPERFSAEDVLNFRADRITILTSADEAAVVAAYQTIKELTQAAGHPSHTLPPVGLAIVGCDHAAAEAVIERLNRTTVSFLGVNVRLNALLPRIDASARCMRHMTFAGESQPSLTFLRGWIEQSRALPPRQAAPLHEAPHQSFSKPPFMVSSPEITGPDVIPSSGMHETRAAPTTGRAPAFVDRQHVIEPPRRSNPVFASASRQGDAGGGATLDLPSDIAQSAMRLPPKVVVEFEPKVVPNAVVEPEEAGRPVSLARFVEGLSALPIRPPGYERVELALDSRGVLHVLAREDNLRAVPVVLRWAWAHRELLALACPQQRFESASHPVAHVFTAEPARLADLHGSDLRLHVLAPVTVGAQTTWYAAALNLPSP